MAPHEGQVSIADKGTGTRWKKGQSGNPKGRPRKEESLTSLLWEVGEEPNKDEPNKSNARVAAERLWAMATDPRGGKTAIDAFELIQNRLLGRPVQAVAVAQELDEDTKALVASMARGLRPVIETEGHVIPAPGSR